MAIANMAYYFGVEYYRNLILPSTASQDQMDLKAEEAARRNGLIRDASFSCPKSADRLPGEQRFPLWTTYPGFMMGIGYPHDGDIKGDICAGFSFDYVTGLPYLPGSSVKGTLRSVFCEAEYIRELLGDDAADVSALERSIFGERLKEDVQVSPDGKVTFLDVYPVESYDSVGPAGETQRFKLLELEAITPHHSGEHGLLSEPKPLTFLELRPGVCLLFRFLCPETIGYGENKRLEASAVRDLFKQILLDLGAGAKTNVGFGSLVCEKPAAHAAANAARQPSPAARPVAQREAAPRTPTLCRTCGKPTDNDRFGEPQAYCKACRKAFQQKTK